MFPFKSTGVVSWRTAQKNSSKEQSDITVIRRMVVEKQQAKDDATDNEAEEIKLKSDKSPPSTTKSKWASFVENFKLIAIALLIATTVRIFIAEPRYIPSPSMVPTLAVGDRLLVDKVSYHSHPPEPGDIVVFEPPPQLQEYGYLASQAFIKRVIALPGQTIRIAQGLVFVDGQPLKEPYILAAPAYEMPPVEVPPGSLFVMGDNRNDSNDSHVWGFLPIENVIGKAAFRFWPWPRLGPLRSAQN